MSLQSVRRLFSYASLSTALLMSVGAGAQSSPDEAPKTDYKTRVYVASAPFIICGKDHNKDYGLVLQFQSSDSLLLSEDTNEREEKQSAHTKNFRLAMLERWNKLQKQRTHDLFGKYHQSREFDSDLNNPDSVLGHEIKTVADDIYQYALIKVGTGGFGLDYSASVQNLSGVPEVRALCDDRRKQGLTFN